MTKKAYFYIDDTIWVLRDITRQRPEKLFDNPFLKTLKETRLFTRGGADTAISRSICGYNHFDRAVDDERFMLSKVYDANTGMYFKKFCNAPCLNLTELNEMEEAFGKVTHHEYLGICVHEQYYYLDYYQYQPDYAKKIYKMGEILRDSGYEYMLGEELI